MRRLLTVLIGISALGVAAPAHAAVNFAPKTDYPVTDAFAAAAGDFNNDDRVDVATANFAGTDFSVVLGDGDGGLGTAATTAGPSQQSSIAAGDLNGDGRDDVVVVDIGTDNATVFLRQANGTFAAGTPYPVGAAPQDAILANMGGNSALDIVIASQTGNDVRVLLNNGSGTFAALPPIAHPQTGAPDGVAAGDLDDDGDNDIAIGTTGGGQVGWSRNNAGTFTAPVDLGTAGQKVVTGDFNGNGVADIGAARTTDGDVAIIRSNGDGTFAAATTFDPDPAAHAIAQPARADLDGDGTLDLAIPNINGPNAGTVSTAFGGGDGTFTLGAHEPVGALPRDVLIADFDRDGNPDLATGNDGGNDVSVLLAEPPVASVTPSALDFGTQVPDTESSVRTTVIRNNGAPRLRLGPAALTGANASQFRIASNNCNGANLGIGQECRIGVTFRPTGTGARTAGVVIPSNGAGGSYIIQLRGTSGTATQPTGNCANDLSGTPAGETLNGSPFGDNIFGFGGNDVLNGLAGNDCLTGGRGNDRLNGGPGNDSLEGESGRDVASGSTGNDRMTGGSSRDRLSGGSGRDTMNGGSSHDRLSGGSGNDRISGSSGNDRLTGSGGNDRLTGGSGKNIYSGGSGRDTIKARNRRVDRINCGSGRDTATVDRRDRVRRCERVRRSRR